MVLCEEIMYLAPLTTEDDKLLGLSLEMARAASAAAEHTLQRALAVEADIDKLVAYISVRAGKIESVRAAMAKQQTRPWFSCVAELTCRGKTNATGRLFGGRGPRDPATYRPRDPGANN